MKFKENLIDHDERHDTKYRIDHEHYEYLSRLAHNATHNSVQRIMDDKLFPRTWRKELETMRADHRKLGIKDHVFFHSAIQRKLGLNVKMGRRPRTFKKVAA